MSRQLCFKGTKTLWKERPRWKHISCLSCCLHNVPRNLHLTQQLCLPINITGLVSTNSLSLRQWKWAETTGGLCSREFKIETEQVNLPSVNTRLCSWSPATCPSIILFRVCGGYLPENQTPQPWAHRYPLTTPPAPLAPCQAAHVCSPISWDIMAASTISDNWRPWQPWNMLPRVRDKRKNNKHLNTRDKRQLWALLAVPSFQVTQTDSYFQLTLRVGKHQGVNTSRVHVLLWVHYVRWLLNAGDRVVI